MGMGPYDERPGNNNPKAIAADTLGHIYIVINNRIYKFNCDGSLLNWWQTCEEFQCPSRITLDRNGNILITVNYAVQSYTCDGEFLFELGEVGNGDGQFGVYTGIFHTGPTGIAADNDGCIYVADWYNHRIQKFTLHGEFIAIWGGNGNEQTVDHVTTDAINNGSQKVPDNVGPEESDYAVIDFGNPPEAMGYGNQNGQFNRPRCIIVDSLNNVYVADEGNHRIQKFTSDGTFLTKWGEEDGFSDGQFDSLAAIAVDSSDNVYVVDNDKCSVRKFTPNGTFLNEWGETGDGDGQFSVHGSLDIDVDPSDNIYVLDPWNHRVQKFTSDGIFLAKWGTNWRSTVEWRNDGIDLAALGRHEEALECYDKAIQIEPDNGSFWIDRGIVLGTLQRYQEALDSFDKAIRVGPGSWLGRVMAWMGRSEILMNLGRYEEALKSIDEVIDIYASVPVLPDDGSAWCNRSCLLQKLGRYEEALKSIDRALQLNPDNVDFQYNRTLILEALDNDSISPDPQYQVKPQEPEPKTINWGDKCPNCGGDMERYFGTTGKCTVCDKRVKFRAGQKTEQQKTSHTAKPKPTTPLKSISLNECLLPNRADRDMAGNIYVVDDHCVMKFSSDGKYICEWGRAGTGKGQYDRPKDIALDGLGHMYVADTYNNRIQKLTMNGKFLMRWGTKGRGDGQFNWPWGITTDSYGNVYVTDNLNHRVQRFTTNGVFMTKWGTEGSDNGQFKHPRGIAVDGSGNVYVVDSNNDRIQKFTPDGKFLTKWGENGSGNGQFEYPRGIEISKSGDIYVYDSGYKRIQKFTLDGEFLTKQQPARRLIDTTQTSPKAGTESCYIVTMCFGIGSPEYMDMVYFRDNTLGRYGVGRAIIYSYYRIGGQLVKYLGYSSTARAVSTHIVRGILVIVRRWNRTGETI